MRVLALISFLLTLLAAPLAAQQDDKNFLENWLQDNLSDAGRQVTVTGFDGALSSRATLREMTIADDDGVWLVLRGAELDWTRSALVRGRLEVNRLIAEEIELLRRPAGMGGAEGPKAEATDFALPELPVAVNIGRIEAARVLLGAGILGQEVVLGLSGAARLDGGAGEANLEVLRLDAPGGALRLNGAFSNETKALSLDLDFSEPAGGLVSGLVGLPGNDAVDLTVQGAGPLSDFTADLALSTAGQLRVTGQVALSSVPGAAATDPALGTAFRADLTGDVGALLLPEYRTFFGPDTRLTVQGQRLADGRLELPQLSLVSAAAELTGDIVLGPGGWPERATLSGRIAAPEGGRVLLPLGGTRTEIADLSLSFDYDAAAGEAWSGQARVNTIARPDMGLRSLALQAQGRLRPAGTGQLPGLTGEVEISALGLALVDPALAAAVGDRLTGGATFAYDSGAPLRLTALALQGQDYGLAGNLDLVADPARLRLRADGALVLGAQQLSRFAELVGQPVQGSAVTLRLSGTAALPGGGFDLAISGQGQDLGLGQPRLDPLFTGESTLNIEAVRDTEGTRIRRFLVEAPGASAYGTGSLADGALRGELELVLPDTTLVAEGLSGSTKLTAGVVQQDDLWQVTLNGRGPGQTSIAASGDLTIGADGPGAVQGEADLQVGDLSVFSALAGRPLAGAAQVQAAGRGNLQSGALDVSGDLGGQGLSAGLGSADRLLAGTSRADFALRRTDGGIWFADRLNVETPELSASVTGSVEEAEPSLRASARLRELGLFVPGLTGPVSAEGTARLSDGNWRLDLSGTGPGGAVLDARGTLAADAARADLALTGQAPLALANPFVAPRQLSGLAGFDLRLEGPLSLGALSGRVSTEGGRVSLPTFGLSFDPLQAAAVIAGGQAQVDARASVSTGGRLELAGPVGLTAPFNGQLGISLDDVVLIDPALYETEVDGTLQIDGPLAGGALISGSLSLDTTEIQVPESGIGAAGSLPDLRHIGEPAAVRATRARAGLLRVDTGGGGAVYGLNLAIDAPNRVFVRGRGLDAELGGRLVLGGTTQQVAALGGFDLIRGRLEVLGIRLALTEGRATLDGSLDPSLRLVAESQAADITARITLSGRASDPQVTFSSSPDLPQDEILARLLFGREMGEISPLQALKLADAAASLSGRGGDGLFGGLRKGIGLDDLDLTQSEDGSVAVSAGKYLSENIYTDVTVDGQGQTEINLNLTITPSVTAKGRLGADGDTGLGLFFERDY